ncbi:hypothetical protein [Inquilinus sp. CA228]|uniref:hypothetical protein n=1 Tax=Inquilinus sp. CA228 TaxID=3455609 RepID=UPI003F8D586B
MLARKWALIAAALVVWIASSAQGLEFSDYRTFVIIADNHVRQKYPFIDLNRFSRDLEEEGTTISVHYPLKPPKGDSIVIGGGNSPAVFIDKATVR